MKRIMLILLPLLAVFLIANYAFTKPDNDASDISKHITRMMSHHSGMRLGIVLSKKEAPAEQGANEGVKVERVVPGSPAEKAGVQKGDVILSMDGKKIDDPKDLREYIQDMEESKEITLEIIRDGKPMNLGVTPEKRELMRAFTAARKYIGLNLQELNADLAPYFKVDPSAGVLIVSVDEGSPAAKADIRAGDIVTHVNGVKVADPRDVRKAMADTEEGQSAELTLLRHGNEKKVTVKPEERGFRGDFPMMERTLEFLETPEFREDMKKLEKEMESLRFELENKIKKEDIERLKEEIQRNVSREVEELRKELRKDLDED